jgi:hypothetical protein
MLGTIFLIVGIILLLLGAAGVAANVIKKQQTRHGETFERMIPRAVIGPLFALGILSILFQPATFYANPGYSYFVQTPWGAQITFINQPGYHLKWFGSVSEWKQVLSVVNSRQDAGAVTSQNPPIGVRFNDAVHADLSQSSRFRLPQAPDDFRKLVLEFRSQDNLVNATLTKVVAEVGRNTARMFAAQQYVIGQGGEFESAYFDQLTNGIYVLETETVAKTGSDELVPDDRKIQGNDERVKLIVRKKLDSDGNAIRKINVLAQYGIEVTQATVSDVDPEERFKIALGKQRDAAAAASVKRQEARTLGLEALRIKAEGEAEKTRIQIEQEKKQIEIVTAAQTKALQAEQDQREQETRAATLVKVAEQERLKEETILKTEKIRADQAGEKARAIQVLAEAEANKRKLIMEADNALAIRLENELKIHQAYAQALRDKKLVPDVVINGGESGGSDATGLIQLIKAKLAKDLADKTSSQ